MLPAAVTEDEFIIMNLQADIEGGFPARAEDAHRGRRFRLITAVAAGKDKRHRAGQDDIRFAGQVGTEQRVDRIPDVTPPGQTEQAIPVGAMNTPAEPWTIGRRTSSCRPSGPPVYRSWSHPSEPEMSGKRSG
jgi:hypothetical protein